MGVDCRPRRIIEGGNAQPRRTCRIRHPAASAAGPGDNADALALRQPAAPIGEARRDIDDFFDVPALDHAVPREHRIVCRIGSREGGRVRRSGPLTRLGMTDLGDDDRFAHPQRLLGHNWEQFRRLDVLDEHSDDVRAVLLQHVLDELEPFKAGLVARRHHVAEGQLSRAAAIVEGEPHAAALCDDANPAILAESW